MAYPLRYKAEIADEIIRRMSEGESLDKICQNTPGFPSASSVRYWALQDYDGFAAKHKRAQELRAHKLFEELLEICDTPEVGTVETDQEWGTQVQRRDMIEHRKLKVDTRKWYLGKVMPKLYGDRQQIDHQVTMTISERLKRAEAAADGDADKLPG